MGPGLRPGALCRGGWSWYTGAAGWLHRAAIESLFGLCLTHDALWFEPCLPTSWERVRLTLRREHRCMHFLLHRGENEGEGRALRIGERLRWRDLPADSHFSIRLD